MAGITIALPLKIILLDFSFQYIWPLAALVLIPALFLLYLMVKHWKKRVAQDLGGPQVVQRLVPDYSPATFRLKYMLGLAALSLILLGAANLRQPGGMQQVTRQGVDIMIALDVSKSMLAEDIAPSRLGKAKLFIRQLIAELPNDRVGLILFAGRAYLQMPLSSDHAAALMLLQNAGPAAVPSQGTVIAEALDLGNRAFNSRERKYKSLILVSDGEDHDPRAVPLAEELARNGVMINTIGIGLPGGALVPEPATGMPKRDAAGKPVVSKLNEQELRQLAELSNGIYINLNDPEQAVNTLKAQLNTIERTALEDQAFVTYKSYFQWFLGLALLLLLIEFFLPENARLKWKRN